MCFTRDVGPQNVYFAPVICRSVQGVAIDNHKVSPFSDFQTAYFILHAQLPGTVDGHGSQRLKRRDGLIDAEDSTGTMCE